MAEGGRSEILMKEGGEQAVTALSQIILNARYLDTRSQLAVKLDTNFYSRDPKAEHWEMGATQFLEAWRDLEPYFDGIDLVEFGFHDNTPFTWRGRSETEFRKISPRGREADRLISELNSGQLHPHAFVRPWTEESKKVRGSAEFDGHFLHVYLQVEASIAGHLKKNHGYVQVRFSEIKLLYEVTLQELERISTDEKRGDIYEEIIDLSGTSVPEMQQFDVILTIEGVPRKRILTYYGNSVVEKVEIINVSEDQKKVRARTAHHWKTAQVRAGTQEVVRYIKGEKTNLLKPLATPDKPWQQYGSSEQAKLSLASFVRQLGSELRSPNGQSGCALGFLPHF
jgi:hypothetical protein